MSKRNPIAASSLKKNGAVIVAKNDKEASELANRIASEHLTVDDMLQTKSIQNAGSLFVGRFSAQPFGDYIAGPNHTLPTGGLARERGGLSVLDFLKIITVQELSKKGIRLLAPDGALLAAEEGLLGHLDAIRTRLELV
jgi:histidinol dehydrogenase